MNVDFELKVEARCARCGAVCDVPQDVERQLQSSASDIRIFVTQPTACTCGSKSAAVTFNVGSRPR